MLNLLTLAIIFTLNLCFHQLEINGFQLPGIYDIPLSCDVYLCPNTKFLNQDNFVCPKPGSGNGQITYDGNNFKLEFITETSTSTGGYASQEFSKQDIIDKLYIKLPLQNKYYLYMLPCYEGTKTSIMCPQEPEDYQQTMIVWKSNKGFQYPQYGCSFLMERQ